MVGRSKDETLGYYIRNISHELYYMGDQTLKSLEITNQQGRLLSVIYDSIKDGTEISRRFLEDYMHLKGPSVTSILRGLEEKGYIIRTTRQDDARAMVLTLTDKGERLVKEVRSVFSNVEQALQCGLNQEEKDMLMNLLAKVCRNLPEESKR